MGIYLNPGNSGFEIIRKTKYVDKSGLISIINKTIETTDKLTCVSRPRRFGKSFTAKMLCAYYDKTCDSHALFAGLEISDDETFSEHINSYDVLYIDMSFLKPLTDNFRMLIPYISNALTNELYEAYPREKSRNNMVSVLIDTVSCSGNKFIMIIDEWDAPIRENPSIQGEYLDFLRMLFKSSGTTDQIFSAVYMTGILPIKKDGSQSALSDFNEHTMIDPGNHARFFGFTSDEVKALCSEYNVDFSEMKRWYDGYTFDEKIDIYNPNSVIKAVISGKFKSYWTQSSATDSLIHFIGMNFDGLSKTVAELIGGSKVSVNVNMFDNDLVSFRNKDSVLSLLIHLGYLAYNDITGKAVIPNEEIRIEYSDKIKEVKMDETIKRVTESNKLIMDTVNRNEEAVAAQIEKIHEEETAAIFYNNEQALRSIIKLAYFAYKDYFISFEELPSGTGLADIVYFPKKDTTLPALLIELKWDKTAEGAVNQIKDRHYPTALQDYGGEILLVGINYDKNAEPGKRHHTCIIEPFDK